jgi:phage shock protein PspC (stress-responsive transcriptional regulator)
MKKTFTINISGSIFHIDEDAYEKLQKYLQMLNRHFGTAVEGQEILQDIEARIAELFIEKTSNKMEVVTDSMVDEVMDRMGRPEDFMEPNDEEPTAKAQTGGSVQDGEPQIRRRLYRDGDNRVLGGVCSGLGAYFNIDMVILRVIFVVAIFIGFGASFLLYIILWIVVPKAKTTAQRLEMRGKEATISNIEKSIKEEVNEIGESYNRFKNSESNDRGARMDRFGDVVGSILRVVLRVIVLLFGAALIICGIASLIGFITTMAVGHSFLHGGAWNFGWDSDINMANLVNHFVSPGAYTISLIAILLLVGIPILVLLFIGTKLLFRYKTNNKLIGLGTFGLWLLALVTLIIVGVNQVGNFSKQTSQTITQKVECTNCKTIYLETTDDLYESLIDDHISLDRMKVAEVNGKEKLLGHPRFTIEKSTTGEFLLQIKKRARGSNTEDAQKNVEQIDYNFSQKDSTLRLDPYYFLKDNAKWREQEVTMILKVPEGKSIFMNEKMKTIIYDIENVNNMWDGDMVGKIWTMTADGLKLKETIVPIIKK